MNSFESDVAKRRTFAIISHPDAGTTTAPDRDTSPLAAFRATSDPHCLVRMRESFEWFLGKNRLRLPVYNFGTGGCHDALGRHEVNQNQGAESTLAFLLSLLTMIDVVGLDGAGPPSREAAATTTNPSGAAAVQWARVVR